MRTRIETLDSLFSHADHGSAIYDRDGLLMTDVLTWTLDRAHYALYIAGLYVD